MPRLSTPAPVGRLAPSPTGLLHVGHARTFVLAWCHARSRGGNVVLRIDDLDGERCRHEFVEHAVRDLAWLGLDWDGPVYLESAGLEAMNAAIARLLDRGLAYPCTCTRSDIALAQSAPQRGSEEVRYPGTCRGRYDSLAEAERKSGRKPAVRLRVPDGITAFQDGLFGAQSYDVQAEVGDFAIARRDGSPAYQLAVVIDDSLQGVTEVVRGCDLLSSTARQIAIANLIQITPPSWLHLPLVTDENDRRLAKRERALGLAELRERGVAPQAIVGWALRSAGLDYPARITPNEAFPTFDAARLSTAPARLTRDTIESWRG